MYEIYGKWNNVFKVKKFILNEYLIMNIRFYILSIDNLRMD